MLPSSGLCADNPSFLTLSSDRGTVLGFQENALDLHKEALVLHKMTLILQKTTLVLKSQVFCMIRDTIHFIS